MYECFDMWFVNKIICTKKPLLSQYLNHNKMFGSDTKPTFYKRLFSNHYLKFEITNNIRHINSYFQTNMLCLQVTSKQPVLNVFFKTIN